MPRTATSVARVDHAHTAARCPNHSVSKPPKPRHSPVLQARLRRIGPHRSASLAPCPNDIKNPATLRLVRNAG